MGNKKISIVIPCLNEEKVIGDVIRDCWIGLGNNKEHQVLIIDSGNDRSGQIAKDLGADVLKTPKRGLGQAYLDAIPHIKGDYVVMGDADGTYDFKETPNFVKKLDEGYEYVMGTRMRGWIEDGAMPNLHRYFGTPLTTWILNKLFKLKFSDIHCGLRVMTLEALKKIDLRSRSWEYASEMVIKAGLLKLKTAEVPIHFYKDKKGRVSHHKRIGWFSPWQAGWINLKIMLLYAPNFIFFIPGFFALIAGIAIVTASSLGLIQNFRFHFSLLGFALITIGYLTVQLGVISKRFSDLSKYYQDRLTLFMSKKFNYDRGMIFGIVLVGLGLILDLFLFYHWYKSRFTLESISVYGVIGLILITLGFQTIFFTFINEIFKISRK
jgi:glycosyltransferase involved in cell wall biosynthesis